MARSCAEILIHKMIVLGVYRDWKAMIKPASPKVAFKVGLLMKIILILLTQGKNLESISSS